MSANDRMPMFHQTWPKLGEQVDKHTKTFLNSLGHQDWDTITIRRGGKTGVAATAAHAPPPPAAALGNKLANAETPGKLKMLAPSSRLQLINTRVANKWSQIDLNRLCNFPPNVIRDLEAGKLSPTLQQLNTLNRVLKTGLKLQ